MALENLTLFELHLENSRFGPRFGGDDGDEGASAEGEASEDSSGRGLGRVLGALILVGIAAMAVRRYRSAGEEGVEEDSDQITIEHAAEQ